MFKASEKIDYPLKRKNFYKTISPFYFMERIFFSGEKLKNNPTSFLKMPTTKMIMKSNFVAQYQEGVKKGIYRKVDPIHFVTNVLSVIVFPFMCSPIIMKIENLSKKDFNIMMTERKKLIPAWIIQMIKK